MSLSLRPLALLTLLAAPCLLMPLRFAVAQDEEDTPPQRSQQPLDHLKAALPYVKWEARTHGPLIAIAPEKIGVPPSGVSSDFDTALGAAQLNREKVEQEPLLPPKDQYGLSADKVAKHFGRRLIRYQTMAIYVPPTMIVLNADLKPANPFLTAPIDDKLRRLGATLTEGQWAQLGSSGGLGFGDMTKDQQALFDDVLPEKMTLDRETVKQYEGGYIGSEQVDGSEKTLNPGQRLGVRLHLTRQASFSLVDAKDNQLPISSPFHADVIGSQKVSLTGETETLAHQSTLFGQQVRYEAPNTLKPSDLDLKQPLLQDTYVPLTGVKTVEDLLKAAQKATGLELHVDKRLARLPVYVSTETRLVHASDLLEGLCMALTATYRQVGPIPGGDPKDFAYTLTYDRVGLGVIHGQISAWARRGKALREQNSRKFDESIKKQKPGQYVEFAKGDPLAPTNDALQALKSAKQTQASRIYDEDDPNSYYNSGQSTVPITALSAEQRQQMSAGLKELDKQHANNPDFPVARTDRVSMWTSFGLSYVVPGAGEIRSESSLYGDDTMDEEDPEVAHRQQEAQDAQIQKSYRKQIALLKMGPVSLPQAVLCIAPKTVEAAETVLAAARGLGFSEVWVDVPDSSPGLKLLVGCVAAGKSHGVAVGARVPLIHWSPTEANVNPQLQDVNLYGQTESAWAADVKRELDSIGTEEYKWQAPRVDKRDALAPEKADSRRRLTTWLGDVTAIPGLAGVSLHEAASPGHDWSAETHDYVRWAGTTFGYTVANRLAFLREKGYDPIDFDENTNDYEDWELRMATKIPRFDTKGEEDIIGYYQNENDGDKPKDAWNGFRGKSESDFLIALRDSVAKNHPLLPIYLGSYDSDGESWAAGNYLEWKAGALVPFSTPPLDANAVKKPLLLKSLPVGAKSDLLLHIVINHDLLSYNGEGDEAKTELEKIDPSIKSIAPGGYIASYIREAIKGASYDMNWNNGSMQKKMKPGPKGVILDLTTVSSDDILKIMNGVLTPVGK